MTFDENLKSVVLDSESKILDLEHTHRLIIANTPVLPVL